MLLSWRSIEKINEELTKIKNRLIMSGEKIEMSERGMELLQEYNDYLNNKHKGEDIEFDKEVEGIFNKLVELINENEEVKQ